MLGSTCRHGLGDQTLQSKLLLLQIVTAAVFDFELCHSVAESCLDLFPGATLELER